MYNLSVLNNTCKYYYESTLRTFHLHSSSNWFPTHHLFSDLPPHSPEQSAYMCVVHPSTAELHPGWGRSPPPPLAHSAGTARTWGCCAGCTSHSSRTGAGHSREHPCQGGLEQNRNRTHPVVHIRSILYYSQVHIHFKVGMHLISTLYIHGLLIIFIHNITQEVLCLRNNTNGRLRKGTSH